MNKEIDFINYNHSIYLLNLYGMSGRNNSRLNNLKFLVMKCFIWIKKLKNI